MAVFWDSGNYMVVATSPSFGDSLYGIPDDNFAVKANHDTAWKSDTFNFFGTIMQEPNEISMPSFKIVKVTDAFVDD